MTDSEQLRRWAGAPGAAAKRVEQPMEPVRLFGDAMDCKLDLADAQTVEEMWTQEERAAYIAALGILDLPGEDLALRFLDDVIATSPLPPAWSIHRDEAGNAFFLDNASGTTTMAYPFEVSLRQLAALCRECLHLPLEERHGHVATVHRVWTTEAESAVAMWRSVQCDGGEREYYFHIQTHETTWVNPTESLVLPYRIRLSALNRIVNDDYLRLLASSSFAYPPVVPESETSFDSTRRSTPCGANQKPPSTEVSPERFADAPIAHAASPARWTDAPSSTSELRRQGIQPNHCEDSAVKKLEDELRVVPGEDCSPEVETNCPHCLMSAFVEEQAERERASRTPSKQRSKSACGQSLQRTRPRSAGAIRANEQWTGNGGSSSPSRPCTPSRVRTQKRSQSTTSLSKAGTKELERLAGAVIGKNIGLYTPKVKTPALANLEMACATWPTKTRASQCESSCAIRLGATPCTGSAASWLRRTRAANAELERDNDELRRLVAEALELRKQEILMKPLASSAKKEERRQRIDLEEKSRALKEALVARANRCAARPETVAEPPTVERWTAGRDSVEIEDSPAHLPQTTLVPLALISKLEAGSARASPRKWDSAIQSTACSSLCPNTPRLEYDVHRAWSSRSDPGTARMLFRSRFCYSHKWRPDQFTNVTASILRQ